MLKDRFFLLCFLTSVVIMISSVFMENGSEDGEVGVIHDVSSSSSGYVFTFEDADGKSFRCFSKSEPADDHVCMIGGSYSDDGSIFFVSTLTVLC